MKLYTMEDIIETLISVPDIKGAPYIELEEKLLELKPAMIIPECGGCMGPSYNPRDCEECDRREKMPINFYDICDIAEVERDAFERGYKAASEEKIMGRDLISRKEAIKAIEEIADLILTATNLPRQQKDIKYIKGACIRSIDELPTRIPAFKTFCGLDIEEAAEIIERNRNK